MNYDNKPINYYSNVRFEMLKYLPTDTATVLEIGCGNGRFAEEIKKIRNTTIWGIELMEDEGEAAKKILDKVFIGECEKFVNELPENYFDVIYINDVLEHLFDPYTLLKNLKSKLTASGRIISSMPNMRYHVALKNLVLNHDWKYESSGIMDYTHMRFFTYKSIKRMYEDAGYKVVVNEGINKTKSLRPYLYNLLFLFTQKDIFYLQFATVAQKK